MFGFTKKPSYTDGEINIVLERKYGRELFNGIEKTDYFAIYLYKTHICVGYIDYRKGNSEYLYYMGNIGYHIDEPYRHHRYATKALKLILKHIAQEKVKKLIITCNPDNIASYKTIEGAGGKLLETVDVPEWHELYWRNEKRKCIFEITL